MQIFRIAKIYMFLIVAVHQYQKGAYYGKLIKHACQHRHMNEGSLLFPYHMFSYFVAVQIAN